MVPGGLTFVDGGAHETPSENGLFIILFIATIASCGLFSPEPQSYSVSFAVSGLLDGNSVTMDLNGEEQLTATADGNFFFPTKVAEGAEYRVTVKEQPTGQTATVSNAVGVMPAGPVTNVEVAVTTNTYTVGGTVQGLGSGETVSLTLNSFDPLEVAADGSFTFPDRLGDEAVYTVAISQYVGDGTYTLTNSTGRIDGVDIENVSVIIATTLTDIPTSSPTTLTPGGIYLVADNDEVVVNSELNIYEGTKIIFGSNSSMRVYEGSLTVEGSESEPVIFTGKNEVSGYWKGLVFYNSNSTSNSLDHVIVEYAGSNTLHYADQLANIAVTQLSGTPCRVAISNTTMRHGEGYGFYADPGVTVSSFTSNTCTENTLGAAYMSAGLVPVFGSDSNYSGNINDNDFVYIDAGRTPDVESATAPIWSDIGVPFRIGPTAATLEVDGELTIEAGCEFEVELGTEIRVRNTGTLIAVGTDVAPILFTGTTAQKGHWKGINFFRSNAGANHLSHVTVEYAGSDTMFYADVEAGVAIVTSGVDSRCLIDNCTLKDNIGYGLFADDNAELSGFDNNTITGNTVGAVSLYANNVAQLDATSTYTGNTADQVYINVSPAITIAETWHNIGTDVTYLIGPNDDDLTVNAGLTLEAGSRYEFMQWSGVEINSSGFLTAEGESENEIVFTGSTAQAGWWRGINYYRTNSMWNILSHAVVEYAGSHEWGYADVPANISIVTAGAYPSQAAITNCEISEGAGAGIWIDAEATVNADINTSNTFVNCEGGDVVDTRP